ncbi:GNAT family N-acetyltransferase [Streptomyces monticola]|uniref:GNAT family N-acetyltransferase n=1 Tax=Streptomyces monticola TaxID=2666263 RepID=A0ABW2JYP0_9ACTN
MSSSSSFSSFISPLPASSSPASALYTERLVLRRWSLAELRAVTDPWARLAHWAQDYPADGDRVIAGFLAECDDPAAELAAPYGHRQIIERASGLVVGAISLMWPPDDGRIELGYGIVPSRRGRAYAPEAARAMVGFGLGAPGVHTVHADVEQANPASVRVLEKAGLTRGVSVAGLVRFQATRAEPSGS